MQNLNKLNVGVVGAGLRSKSFLEVFSEHKVARIFCVCDTNKQAAETAKREYGASEAYDDYDQMLEKADIDAVIISTPMHLHAKHSIAALKKNIHVLSEVTAAISVEECIELAKAAVGSSAVYVFAENMNYVPAVLFIEGLIRKGYFGQPYFAHGEYLHPIGELVASTPWRRKWHVGIDGITYGTHSVGPILQWMGKDRIKAVSCQGSGYRHADLNGLPYAQNPCVMMCKTVEGALVTCRVDLVSKRPLAHNYVLQASHGCCEISFVSSHSVSPKPIGKVYLSDRCKEEEWIEINNLMSDKKILEECMPEIWHRYSTRIGTSHWGSDTLLIRDFIDTIVENKKPRIGIHEAMDQTLPGLISQQSIAQNGVWLDVPDSRRWV